jgi:cell division initiation protein
MKLTAADIQQRRFKMRFRGFDIHEVDSFLEQIATRMEDLETENRQLNSRILQLSDQCGEYQEREGTFKRAMDNTQQVLERMNENARKSAEVIISNAEVKAEKILNRSYNRLSQINEDIAELKRQRLQIEAQIRAVVETHARLLDVGQEEMMALEAEYDKVKVLKQT